VHEGLRFTFPELPASGCVELTLALHFLERDSLYDARPSIFGYVDLEKGCDAAHTHQAIRRERSVISDSARVSEGTYMHVIPPIVCAELLGRPEASTHRPTRWIPGIGGDHANE
jgi:hypothetical protein